MCEYLDIEGNKGRCKVTNQICPYAYFCNKTGTWKPSSHMPAKCKVKEQADIPKGYYQVCFERKGNLYVDIEGCIQIIPNPFDNVPLYVKATKLKSGKWRLKKAGE